MTAIHQSTISSHHSIDDAGHHSGNRNEGGVANGRQATDNSTWDAGSSTVTISYQAARRLQAYQEQKQTLLGSSGSDELSALKLKDKNLDSNGRSVKQEVDLAKQDRHDEENTRLMPEKKPSRKLTRLQTGAFPQNIENMLTEVQDNIVRPDEPGYQHLITILANNADSITDQNQLQEIMRKEQFFLNRRKAFMDSTNYQSYSQVLSQFTNIIERQQFSL